MAQGFTMGSIKYHVVNIALGPPLGFDLLYQKSYLITYHGCPYLFSDVKTYTSTFLFFHASGDRLAFVWQHRNSNSSIPQSTIINIQSYMVLIHPKWGLITFPLAYILL